MLGSGLTTELSGRCRDEAQSTPQTLAAVRLSEWLGVAAAEDGMAEVNGKQRVLERLAGQCVDDGNS